jgi:protein-S-isoprenylcysteine O-methyltransferase Ste14
VPLLALLGWFLSISARDPGGYMIKPPNALPDIILFGLIVGAYLLDHFAPVIEVIGSPFNYFGWALIVVGLVLGVKSISILRKRASSDVIHTSSVLITDGLYSLSRNPLYASELLMIAGVSIALGSLAALCAPVLYVVIIGRFVIPFEESQLSKKFGSKYKTYMSLVRRWI